MFHNYQFSTLRSNHFDKIIIIRLNVLTSNRNDEVSDGCIMSPTATHMDLITVIGIFNKLWHYSERKRKDRRTWALLDFTRDKLQMLDIKTKRRFILCRHGTLSKIVPDPGPFFFFISSTDVCHMAKDGIGWHNGSQRKTLYTICFAVGIRVP